MRVYASSRGTVVVLADPEHSPAAGQPGTITAYSRGCRCELCRGAHTIDMRARRALEKGSKMKGNSNPSGPERPNAPGPMQQTVCGTLNTSHWWNR